MIYSSDIVTVVEPKESMIRYYDKLVERTLEEMVDSDKLIEDLLEENEEKEIEEDVVEEIVQQIKEVRNKKLH
jgi:transcriptional regulator NrdR family protein